MTEPGTESAERLLGRVEGSGRGPTMIAMAVVHGNEVAGLHASRRVLADLQRRADRVRGRMLFVLGNLGALQRRTRFVDVDLNRAWTRENVAQLSGQGGQREPAERAEQRELIRLVAGLLRDDPDPVYLMDMHTSSAPGPPFLTVGDTLRNRSFAQRFPLPLILGLEEQIDGSLLEYLNDCGFITLGVEGGQHESPEAADLLEATLWLAFTSAGMIHPEDVPAPGRYERLLEEASRGIPRVIEVRQRHAITARDGFRMEPGFRNFQQIRSGQRLASDARGEVLASTDGLLLLPLYQGKGDDGFFIAREVRPVWLRVSAALRWLRAEFLLPLLPGVRRRPGEHESLLVNTRIARWFPLELFHLFGFRRLRGAGAELIVGRRRYDRSPPQRVRFPGP